MSVALFTERHGMREALVLTSQMTDRTYSILLECCEKYYNNIAWRFPKVSVYRKNELQGVDFKNLSNNKYFPKSADKTIG